MKSSDIEKVENERSFVSVLRMSNMTEITGLSKSTIYSLMNPRSPQHDESFPKPLRLTERSVGWLDSDVHDWIASRRGAREL